MPSPNQRVTFSSADLQAMRAAGMDQTDWTRVHTMREEEIVCDADTPEATEEAFTQGFITIPVHLAAEIWQWLHDQGQDYDDQINAILRAHIVVQQTR
jgi:uncharacterized protein (DUF4415 family)